jgi:hypothetical protein
VSDFSVGARFYWLVWGDQSSTNDSQEKLMEDRKYSQSGQSESPTTAFPGTESVESSRLDTDKGTDALARSIGNSDGEESPGRNKVSDVAKDAAKATYHAVSAQASELASNVANELETAGEDQKRRGAETMRTFAGAVEHAAAELDEQSPLVARQFRTAARKVEDLSESLRGRSVRDLVNDASDLARRQPLWFFGGALVAGFALSRFLKSSAGTPPPTGERAEVGATANLRPSE